ncbi:MAG: 1,6-anhydro-N-acetylmuramyl-L-alanine amidase AmpD [Rhodoferax sp.]|nr:1,6-anhydro-N-acetylmuramyl-L-alanine amidase AmpD [Rhodoferax sp.]MBK9235896.1 1,6-anhydro-N-acetylmuramyl-L-alanine amidase AmpD [Rhodoferax sp.]
MAVSPPTSHSEPHAPDALWTDGWYRHARPVRSPNFGARPAASTVSLIVLHSISLPPGRYGGDEVQLLFTNQLPAQAHPYFETIHALKVSAHFYVRRNGELWQFVSCDDRAWHAGVSVFEEHANCNDFSVGVELEGLEGDSFEPEQYETLTALCAAIAQRYPIANIAGHEHIAPGRKGDPGPGFDWRRLQHALGWSHQRFPTSPL